MPRDFSAAGNFDHAKTAFPLLGKHVAVGCNECHKTSDFKRPIAHTKCSDCHADAHNGQFLKRADGGDCAACHTVEGFKPAKFGVAEHAASAYPLEGRHATVACEKCHAPAGKATRYRMPFARCTDCHSDPHKGQFAGAPHENRCESCHTVQGYRRRSPPSPGTRRRASRSPECTSRCRATNATARRRPRCRWPTASKTAVAPAATRTRIAASSSSKWPGRTPRESPPAAKRVTTTRRGKT